MVMIVNKSKFLTPKNGKVIKHVSPIEKKALQMTLEIAKQFGEQSKKMRKKKIILR